MVAEESSSSPIKTVVVLVQENRSFDHMLGWFKSLNPEIDGVTGSESNPVSASDPNSTHLQFKNTAAHIDPDPGHSFQAIYEQVFGKPWDWNNPDPNPETGPKMNGFVQNAESIQKGMSEIVMNGFKPETLPVYKELATEFAVCDRWFSSIPSSTQSNRLYLHSATSHGATSNDRNKLIAGYPQKTVFESLEENGHSFGIYYQSFSACFFYKNLRKLKYIDNFHQFDVSFKRHCKEGKLPNYVVIEPRYFDLLSLAANDDHPKHDIAQGQQLVKEIYEALRASPQWNETLFLIIYDEHGGFYDHVPTPVTGVPSPDDIVGPEPFFFKFDRLGVRVPAILVSPWIKPGTVLHGPSGPHPTSQFEHSSIAATLKKIFNLKEFLTKRDAWAGTFEGVLNRSTARADCPVKLSEPVRTRDFDAREDDELSEFQQELVQLAAAVKGDLNSDFLPDDLLKTMNVGGGLSYVEDAFKKFFDEGKKARENGADESEVVLMPNSTTQSGSQRAAPKTYLQQVFSCLICDN
ncbi:hypothetical protein CICLE_v10031241mg [Citrus x clementina]|uniref:Phosphoesterase n=2 Tax=Citrus TaxID=2706 RepID=V4SS11_CITCL|nr:non-specific phospholipase C3 [Citrus x clementina]ESR50618.1 hypothetical protein CICLE_v10031241mg [Citrus x clementina]